MSNPISPAVHGDAQMATHCWRTRNRHSSALDDIRIIIDAHSPRESAYIAAYVALSDPGFVDWLGDGMPDVARRS
jgi:hypothetical protein